MSKLDRRAFLVRSATVLATGPIAHLLACNADEGDATASGSGSTGAGEGSTHCCDSSGETADTRGTTTAPQESTGGRNSSDDTGADAGSTFGGDTTNTTDSTDSTTGDAACDPTPADIEGPFYRAGIPIGGDLDIHGDVGIPLVLRGELRDEACRPLAGAVVEIWHATPVAPGGQPGDADASYDRSKSYRYYGQVLTDKAGRFEFRTLRPGWYLNGADYRPAHVHLKVWVGQVERLTTQLYFVDDPFNANDLWFNPVMALDPNERGEALLDVVV